MGLLDFLRSGPPTALTLPRAEAKDSGTPAMFEMRSSREPYANYMTGQGTDRDPLSAEQPRWSFEPLRRPYRESMFRLDGLARRVVELIPNDATQNGADSWAVLDHSEDPTPLDDVPALDDLHVKVYEADVAARKDGDSAIFMLVEESGEFSDARQALPLDLDAVTALRGLIVVEKAELFPRTYQRVLGSDDGVEFGEPLTWLVTLQRGGSSLTLVVHSSRLVMFQGAQIGNVHFTPAADGWGHDSVLDGTVNALLGVHRARRGRNRVFERIMTWFAKTKFPTPDKATKTPFQDIMDRLQQRWALLRTMTSLGVGLLNDTEEIQQLSAPVSGVADLSEAAIKDLALATGLPVGRWLGEVGGWSGGEAYKADYRASLQSYMKRRYGPGLERIYTVAYATRGPVPPFEIVFNPLEAMDPQQAADERLTLIEGDQKLLEMFPESRETIRRSRLENGWRRDLQPMTLEELDLEEGPDLATLEEALLMSGEPEQDAEGDDDPIKVPAYIVRAAKLGQRLRREHGVGAQSAPEGETPQGVVSARMLASGKVTRGFVRSKMLPFLTRHLKQVASNNERRSPGWQNTSDPSPRWVALLLWGENGNGRAFRWAQSVAPTRDALVTDADFSSSACLSFELHPDDVQAWRDMQAAVAAIVPLEGYDAGDPPPATPHSTILYYGDVRKSNRPHVLRAVVGALAAHTAPTPEPIEVTTFDAGSDGRVPVIIELAPTGLSRFYKAVLVACAPYVTATQFPKYRPHITLGYARPTPEQSEAIKALTPPTLKPFPEITLQWQGAPALHLPLEIP